MLSKKKKKIDNKLFFKTVEKLYLCPHYEMPGQNNYQRFT